MTFPGRVAYAPQTLPTNRSTPDLLRGFGANWTVRCCEPKRDERPRQSEITLVTTNDPRTNWRAEARRGHTSGPPRRQPATGKRAHASPVTEKTASNDAVRSVNQETGARGTGAINCPFQRSWAPSAWYSVRRPAQSFFALRHHYWTPLRAIPGVDRAY